MQFTKISEITKGSNLVIVCRQKSDLSRFGLNREELNYIAKAKANEEKIIALNQYNRWIYVYYSDENKEEYQRKEKARKAGYDYHSEIKERKLDKILIVDADNRPDVTLAFVEGLGLSNYQFLKYFKDADKKKNKLDKVEVYGESIDASEIAIVRIIIEAVDYTRTLVNEPLSFLTAVQLAEEIKKLGADAGFSVEVFDKQKIEELKMGGLLAVNLGSPEPPTFSILEWKPENAKNIKPYVLVGKGVVFDTGGLSLKTTLDSMDYMKSDMSGAAAVIGALYAVAKAKLPVHLMGLIPATENRPAGKAYAPGDVIRMHNGMNVEVLNTDAEGRMILADALSYAQKYDPELVIDLATLTGAAAAAIGKYGIVGMGTVADKVFARIKRSGENVYERIVEFPFWEEYDELLKSDIADIKNIGGKVAGAITAGKFLANFTNYPYLHLDIAGPAWLKTEDSYLGKGASGTGVRLLFDFFRNQV